MNKIKQILQNHIEQHPETKIVKITTTRYYEIPPYSSTPQEELLEEWFKNTPITRSHAFRDGSLLLEHFNDDHQIEEL